MSLSFPTGTAGPAALVRKEQPVAARRAGSLGLLVALGLVVAVMWLAVAMPTASQHPGARGRVNAVAGGRLAAARSIDRTGARTAPVTISGPDTISGPASRAVAAGRGSRSPGASSRGVALTIGKPHTAAASMAWTVSGGTIGFGIAAFCGLFIAAIALATAVPTPSGGSRRGADVARIERRNADAARIERRSADAACLEPRFVEHPATERRAA
jgi:hypothetical protein